MPVIVGRDLIRRRLAQLDVYLDQLAPYRTLDLAAYERDWKTQRIVERTIHLAIETCMDVADHVVADRRLRIPETGAESFEILGDSHIIPADLRRALALIVGFRNILVHDYTRLDPSIVVRVLRDDIRDIERFREVIVAII